ncbi:MAG: phosphatidate cytidylyltransferase [Proteobacteria bacterium]|jgi:phosphatidate cytidylyltransferase|nr:phosphatidate cytidylyltransferase [Alphaproteobacteria bacterium]NCC02889.1 phosphatidate cytidylyltransferase [Pseudomonadota bacterium]
MSTQLPSVLSSNLAQRTISAIVLIPLVLGVVWAGGWPYTILVAAMMMVGAYEWMGLTVRGISPLGGLWMFGLLLLILGIGLWGNIVYATAFIVMASVIVLYFSVLWWGRLKSALWAPVGIPYLGYGGIALIYLRNYDAYGLDLIIYLLAVVWSTDIGAYAAGRLIGGPKLLPKISPKKTWAGLLGGMALASFLGYAAARGFSFGRFAGWPVVLPFSPEAAACGGAILAVIAQAGDFFESYLKRRAGAKDSGRLIPGHGGMLDRVDGLIVAAMGLALYVALVG